MISGCPFVIVFRKGRGSCTGSGFTQELSIQGLSFRCRKPLPVGAHVELLVDWPAKYGDVYPIELQVTGVHIAKHERQGGSADDIASVSRFGGSVSDSTGVGVAPAAFLWDGQRAYGAWTGQEARPTNR